MKVYDIVNAGHRHRFMTRAGVVSNCGRGTQPQNMKKPDEDFDLQGAIDAVRLGDSAAFL
jgi:hypothetical protein